MSEEEPEAEDGLGEDVEDGIGNDLRINADVAGSIGDTPNAISCVRAWSPNLFRTGAKNIHWVDGPKDESEPGNGAEERGGLGVLALDHTAAVERELVHDDQVGNASHAVPAPLGCLLDGEGGEETGQNHDDIGDDGDEDVGTTEAGQQAEVEEQEWGCQGPVDVTGPVDLTVDGGVGVGEVLLRMRDGDLVLADTVVHGHGEVGDHGKGRDERGQDMEEAFLLGWPSISIVHPFDPASLSFS